jgi:hypothetical protein
MLLIVLVCNTTNTLHCCYCCYYCCCYYCCHRLLCANPHNRLGRDGASQIKEHPFFRGVQWDSLYLQPSPFVPRISHEEDTSYFNCTFGDAPAAVTAATGTAGTANAGGAGATGAAAATAPHQAVPSALHSDSIEQGTR